MAILTLCTHPCEACAGGGGAGHSGGDGGGGGGGGGGGSARGTTCPFLHKGRWLQSLS